MTRPSDIVMMDALALSRAIQRKQVSCVEVMTAYLDHIDALNPESQRDRIAAGPRRPRPQAKARDERAGARQYPGWMHGFPHAIKDLTATKGIRTTQGSRIFKDFVPAADAIYRRARQARRRHHHRQDQHARIRLGSKTYNDVFGTTLNAYDQSKTAGGSSGGAGVALALHMLPVADGSDHGGSLRNPAAYNNVFGFRPSFGRVPAKASTCFYAMMGTPGRWRAT